MLFVLCFESVARKHLLSCFSFSPLVSLSRTLVRKVSTWLTIFHKCFPVIAESIPCAQFAHMAYSTRECFIHSLIACLVHICSCLFCLFHHLFIRLSALPLLNSSLKLKLHTQLRILTLILSLFLSPSCLLSLSLTLFFSVEHTHCLLSLEHSACALGSPQRRSCTFFSTFFPWFLTSPCPRSCSTPHLSRRQLRSSFGIVRARLS